MAETHIYDKGDKVRMHARFTVEDEDTDPSTVTLSIRDPDDTIVVLTWANHEVIRGDKGYFYYDKIVSVAITHGSWHYRFECTGAVNSAAENTFRVRASHFD